MSFDLIDTCVKLANLDEEYLNLIHKYQLDDECLEEWAEADYVLVFGDNRKDMKRLQKQIKLLIENQSR